MTTTTNGRRKTGGLVKAPVTDTPIRIATVPDKSVADKYISRVVAMNGKTEVGDFDVFDITRKNGWNVLLEGDTGAGKTMAAMAYAAKNNLHFYSIPNNIGIEPSQLFGKFIPDETGGAIGVWQDGPVTDMVRNGGVLLVNEVNFLPPRVATVLFSLLDGRREIVLLEHKGELIRAHQGTECWCGAADCTDKLLLVVADMNPDYIGTSPMNQAFRNRFEIQIPWDYDPAVEVKLVRSKTLLDLAAKLRKARKEADIVTPTSTNMLAEFGRMVEAFGLGFAISNFVQHYDPDDRKAVTEAIKTMTANLEVDFAPKPKTKPVKKEATAAVGWTAIDDDADVQKWLNS